MTQDSVLYSIGDDDATTEEEARRRFAMKIRNFSGNAIEMGPSFMDNRAPQKQSKKRQIALISNTQNP